VDPPPFASADVRSSKDQQGCSSPPQEEEALPPGVSVRRIKKEDADSPDFDEFQRVSRIALDGLGGRWEVQMVEVWDNEAARRIFEAKQEELPIKNETLVFHGSSHEGTRRIAIEGFRIGGEAGWDAKHGAALGKGVYTGSHPSTALMYSQRSDAGESCSVLLCRAQPGLEWDAPQISTRGRSSAQSDWDRTPLFGDSWSGGLQGVRVFRTAQQLLPTHVIHYTRTPSSRRR